MIDQDAHLEYKREAEEEAERHRHGYEVTLICGGCESTDEVLYDERTDDPWSDLEACEVCGARNWLDG
jgi:hypothetical protein